jgi:AcrR family transcriptional regulator
VSGTTERRSQSDRRATTRAALLRAAAKGLSKHGYANLVLEDVAREAGYTRGALYHLFAGKEDLALAVVQWVGDTWDAEVRQRALAEGDPLTALLVMARGHTIYCRRDEAARVMLTLRVEFAGQDNAVADAIGRNTELLETECAALVGDARRNGSLLPGPPVRLVARAYLGVLESVAIELAGHAPHDLELMDRAVRGLLGVASLPPPRTADEEPPV